MRTVSDKELQGAQASVLLHLRLLATTDLHAHLMPWDYLTDRPLATGLAQLAPMIRRLREDSANSLLLDNGDFLQGSAMGDWFARSSAQGPHPMVQAMNALGYDAGTLGNHEFSHGLPLLRAALAAMRFPVVSANLTGRDEALTPRFTLLDRSFTDSAGKPVPFRIALTGFAPPQTTKWEALKLKGALRAGDILASASAVLAEIGKHDPDLTILLAHTGIGTGTRTEGEVEGMENAALPLAALSGGDVLVTGHTHLTFPAGAETLHGKPAVMAGFHGSHLGLIDLTLTRTEAGWRIAAHDARALPAPPIPRADAELEAIALPAHRGTRQWLARPIGRTDHPLHSHFALLGPSAARNLVARAQAEHMRPEIPPALAHLPLLSAVAPFRTGGRGGPQNFTDIPAGPLLQRHVSDLYLHPNTPVLLLVDGQDVTDWLERAVILFNRIDPDSRDTILIREDLPGFDCDLIDGLSFGIDLTRPPRFDANGTLVAPDARRIIAPTVQGRPIRPDDRFLLVTNSYRAGSGVYPGSDRPPLATSATPIRDILATHIAARGMPQLTTESWRFAPLGGTTVLFDTAPEADRHMTEIAHLHPEPLGLTDKGFLRFRLTL